MKYASKNILPLLLSLQQLLIAHDTFLIGTSSTESTYYATGKTLCNLINRDKEAHYQCKVEATSGAAYNVRSIIDGKFEFALAQSDTIYNAYHGIGRFKGRKNSELRSVMAIYPELLALIVSKHSKIKNLKELKGKNINLGGLGSGGENCALIALEASGVKKSHLAKSYNFDTPKATQLYKQDKIDGYFYMVGHPATNIIEVTQTIPSRIIGLEQHSINQIISQYPYYIKGSIAKGTYEGSEKDTYTFGTKAVLVTTKYSSDSAIRAIIKAVLENFDEFRNSHHAYQSITKESLLEGLSAPLHEAAERYYKSMHLIP